ncbi:GIY-YIG nuclease family protein [Neptunicoccus cionae]|uniref:GIY-YIG nuclease family protein n=1 Tax=Neptunicoccus cionae TaxID=2035344 RepID=UPI0015E0B252|nr:GIY-YIG nuclease family protein [Amylibacter cionae]
MKSGWVYALYSHQSPLIKIGLTTTSPAKRISEINSSKNYDPLGPWLQLDVRQVKDTRGIETALHRQLNQFSHKGVPTASELFEISPKQARDALSQIPASELLAPLPITNLNLEPDFVAYLIALFKNSGIENFRDIQESWTFSLFPKTDGGRFFTLNIDKHEVAFSRPITSEASLVHHEIVVDHMVLKDWRLKNWVKERGGFIESTKYVSSWGNSSTLVFQSTFDHARTLFELPGFRRALIAYWYEALLRMQDRGTRSFFAKNHNYNAVSEIFRHMSEANSFRARLER